MNDLNVNDKLSDNGIKQDLVVTMLMKYVLTNDMSNSLQLNKKRDFADNSFENIKSNKRFKVNKSNVMNDDCKDIIKSTQFLDNIPKQVNISITQLVDSSLFCK